MDIQINKAHYPVTVLGPGQRIGLWLQGCSIGCADCISRDTWTPDPQKAIDIDVLIAWCRDVSADAPDGITLSGGEPFDQPQALLRLVQGLDDWRAERSADFDVLVYSGYPLRKLEREHRAILDRLDALIPEPFVDGLPLGNVWRGSSNQPLVPLSERGRRRYAGQIERAAGAESKRLQVQVEGKRIWYIGIPARGDMARIESACASRGLVFVESSWR